MVAVCLVSNFSRLQGESAVLPAGHRVARVEILTTEDLAMNCSRRSVAGGR